MCPQLGVKALTYNDLIQAQKEISAHNQQLREQTEQLQKDNGELRTQSLRLVGAGPSGSLAAPCWSLTSPRARGTFPGTSVPWRPGHACWMCGSVTSDGAFLSHSVGTRALLPVGVLPGEPRFLPWAASQPGPLLAASLAGHTDVQRHPPRHRPGLPSEPRVCPLPGRQVPPQ